jgi:chromodomain-helicase-DNA-binding protein 1-like
MTAFENAAREICSDFPGLHSPESLKGMESISSSINTDGITLHDHQIRGIWWMVERWRRKRNVIIADEMGLGKTLQTLGFLQYLLTTQSSRGPFLIIAPLSVAPQWPKQCSDYMHSIRVFELWGSAQDRMSKIDEICCSPSRTFDCLISTYESVMSEIEFISSIKWSVIVFDEGHRLKNDQAVTHSVFLERLRSDFKVILTGTPVQNNFLEFWTLIRFLYPSILTESSKPRKNDPLPSKPLLDKLIDTVMLRRLFSEIKQVTLPPLTQLVVRTEMTKIQSDLYKWALFHYAKNLEDSFDDPGAPRDNTVPAGLLSNLMMTLRKISSHPYLIPGVEPEPFKEGEHIWRNSNKFVVLKLLLAKMKRENGRALIFSTFTTLLDVCQDFLDFEKIPYERLDGSVRGEDRVEAISRFENPKETPADIFLLSTRAGGVGLNLSSANWVIFLDSDWNPQMDLQAMARAHRQGQTREVKVFRIVTTKTIDELIFLRTVQKLELARHILSEEQKAEDAPKMATVKDMKNLIAFGLDQTGDKDYSELPKASREDASTPLPLDIENLIESILVDPAELESELVVGYKQFEGVNYGKGEIKSSEENISALDSLIGRAKATPNRPIQHPQAPVVSAAEKARIRAMTEEMRLKRKMEQWSSMNYTSKTIPLVSVTHEDSIRFLNSAMAGELMHLRGSVTDPTDPRHAVVVHVIDSSGIWPTNSKLFMEIAEKFPNVPKFYFQAKEALDLHLGDVHVFDDHNGISLALCVCHRGGFDGMDYDIFKKCINSLSVYYRSKDMKSAFHFSRIGNERGTLYMTEKIIKTYCCAFGFNAYMYYFGGKRRERKRTILDYFKLPPIVKKDDGAIVPPQVEVRVWLSPKIPSVLCEYYARRFRESPTMIDANFFVLSIKDHENGRFVSDLRELYPHRIFEGKAPRKIQQVLPGVGYVMNTEALERLCPGYTRE